MVSKEIKSIHVCVEDSDIVSEGKYLNNIFIKSICAVHNTYKNKTLLLKIILLFTDLPKIPIYQRI